jgi:dipeptidase E
MKNLLLVSTSTVHGTGYLDHCAANVKRLFASSGRVLFVPYALFDRDGSAGTARKRFGAMGIELSSIHEARDPRAAVGAAEGIFIGGGNTFRLLKTLQDQRLIEPIRRRVLDGMPYMGTSAGSNIAGPTIKTTNDMPIVCPAGFEALNLVPFQINPHFIDADPGSTHMGETRETRLREFHEENSTPVIALREGAMLVVEGDATRLDGAPGGKLFCRGADPRDLVVGSISIP